MHKGSFKPEKYLFWGAGSDDKCLCSYCNDTQDRISTNWPKQIQTYIIRRLSKTWGSPTAWRGWVLRGSWQISHRLRPWKVLLSSTEIYLTFKNMAMFGNELYHKGQLAAASCSSCSFLEFNDSRGGGPYDRLRRWAAYMQPVSHILPLSHACCLVHNLTTLENGVSCKSGTIRNVAHLSGATCTRSALEIFRFSVRRKWAAQNSFSMRGGKLCLLLRDIQICYCILNVAWDRMKSWGIIFDAVFLLQMHKSGVSHELNEYYGRNSRTLYGSLSIFIVSMFSSHNIWYQQLRTQDISLGTSGEGSPVVTASFHSTFLNLNFLSLVTWHYIHYRHHE